MENIPIVDAHHHLWDLENEKTKYSWLMVKEGEAFFGDYGAIRKSYLLDDYLKDAKNQNLIKSVHVQAEHDDDSPVSETEWLQKTADNHNSNLPNAIVKDPLVLGFSCNSGNCAGASSGAAGSNGSNGASCAAACGAGA